MDRLLRARPELDDEVATLASEVLAAISVEGVAGQVEEALTGLDPEAVYARAGRKPWGYVHPSEATAEALGEALEPFYGLLEQRLELGRTEEAFVVCQGIVLGSYRAETQSSQDSIAGSEPDVIVENAGYAVDILRGVAGRKRKKRVGRSAREGAFSEAFLDQVPGWADWLRDV
jgi:hypothetical protein